MPEIKSVAEWMTARGIALAELVERSALEERVVKAIAEARYTPGPEQRLRVAGALGVEVNQVAWGHTAPVAHVYGHGPQFGRSP
jgi:hypothetical protein